MGTYYCLSNTTIMAKLSFALALVVLGVAAAAPSYSRRYSYYPDNYNNYDYNNYNSYSNNNNNYNNYFPRLYSSSSRTPRTQSFYGTPSFYNNNQGYGSNNYNNFYPGYNYNNNNGYSYPSYGSRSYNYQRFLQSH